MIEAWVSSNLSKDQLYGWLLDTKNRKHRDAIIRINGIDFEVCCNSIRKNAKRYPLYKDYGFRVTLDDAFVQKLPDPCHVFVIDKQTNTVVYSTQLKKFKLCAPPNCLIEGKLGDTFRDLRIYGSINLSISVETRILVLDINGQKYECVAGRYCSEYTEHLNSSCKLKFNFFLSIDDVLKLPKFFEVKLYDKVTGSFIDSVTYKNISYLIPHNFNEYLNYSMVNPVVYAPYTENHKRCFAFMENVASSLEKYDSRILCSVIMPVFNRESCVLDAINSVLSQTYSNFELIVIDDGSTDNTSSILSQIVDKRVQIIKNKQNYGVSYSRNKGLNVSKGDLIFYLDSDNTWDKRYLKVMVGAFLKNKDADSVYCGQYLYRGNDANCFAVRFASFNRALLENRNYIDINCFGHTRKILDKVVGFDESLSRLVDYDFILRVCRDYRVFSIPVLLSHYYLKKTNNSITETECLPKLDFSKYVSLSQRRMLTVKVTAIIPHYGDIEPLKDCILSLIDNDVTDIIVIDNNSGPRVVEKLDDLSSQLGIKLIKNNTNYGFTYAVNQGLKISDANSDIILVNNDSLFTKGAVEKLSRRAHSLDKVGLIVPRQVINVANKSMTSHVPYADLSKSCDINLSMHFMNIEHVPLFSDGNLVELNYAPFFCVYIRRDVFSLAGYLDAEHGRHYRSDRIYCDKIRNELGLKIYYIGDSIVYHKHQCSTKYLKKNEQDLYDTMFLNNTWSDDERQNLGFTRKVWELNFDDFTKAVKLIKNSCYFDTDYYLTNYAREVFNSELQPIEHYLKEGWLKGFNPSQKFDGAKYFAHYPDVRSLNICPLLHYLTKGIKEGYKIEGTTIKSSNFIRTKEQSEIDIDLVLHSDLFDSEWYAKNYLSGKNIRREPVEHYMQEGWKRGYNPSKNFNNDLYLDLYPDVKRSNLCPLVHYLKKGIKESRKVFPVFNLKAQSLLDRVHSVITEKKPLISIVVASYNYESLIRQTLDSILAQTYKNYEVIIVDDGSTDGSVCVIENYLKYDNVSLYMHEGRKNLGLPETVKLGVEKAKGDYVAFCEADDYWDSNYLLEKVSIINKYRNVNVVVNDVALFGDKDKIDRVTPIIASYRAKFNQSKVFISPEEFRNQNWILTFSCVMLNRNVLKECDFIHVTRKANLDWWLWRQICLDNSIFYINKKLTFWRMHNSYMEVDNIQGRLQQEKFLTEGDKMLLFRNYIKAKSLSKYTNLDLNIVSGHICSKGIMCDYQPGFSVIMPTYNRGHCIKKAIDSVMSQTYSKFELIIVDDGSDDLTQSLINKEYEDWLNEKKIIYIYKKHGGVSEARNEGLSRAKYEWVVYVDTDNICSDIFLETFACNIINTPQKKAFYARLVCWESNKKTGEEFNLEKLLKENYIDLGVYCHNIKLYKELGGFDENMTRLVDWDLITRYSKIYAPLYIHKVILLYCDKQEFARITLNDDLYNNITYFRYKHCSDYPIVTTIITTFNHEKYIAEAIESAIVQMGGFKHEILISDDNSTDKTHAIIKSYVERFPSLIRDVSSSSNLGISMNLKKCFREAKGEFIAILEGDDYWIDKYKIQKQIDFLKNNSDCSMVFSRIKLLNKGKFSMLDRHKSLSLKLSGDDIIKEPTLNLIANFSCCMFRSNIMKNLPDELFNGRFNEIAFCFYVVKYGLIGYISQVMSVYRLHDKGIWSAADKLYKLKSGLSCRKMALSVCENKYRKKLLSIIDKQYLEKIREIEKKEGISDIVFDAKLR